MCFKNPYYFCSSGNACKISKISGNAKYRNGKKRLILNFSSNRRGENALFQCQIDNERFSHCELHINIYIAR